LRKRCKKARKNRVETLISNAIFCQHANDYRSPEQECDQVSRDHATGANRRYIDNPGPLRGILYRVDQRVEQQSKTG
jgi:hypothetical protein